MKRKLQAVWRLLFSDNFFIITVNHQDCVIDFTLSRDQTGDVSELLRVYELEEAIEEIINE